MSDSFCAPCESRGMKVAAHRIVREGGKTVPKCSSCYENNRDVVALQKGPTLAQLAERALAPCPDVNRIQFGPDGNGKEKANMARPLAVDWAAVDRDDNGSISAAALGAKHGASLQQIYQRRYDRKKKRISPATPEARASANGNAKAAAKTMVKAVRATGGIEAAITELESQKALIDTALDALRQLA